MGILKLMRCSQWLTTSQIRRRYFPNATASAARRRLRVLRAAGLVWKYQENPMYEALFGLGRNSKALLAGDGGREAVVRRHPPKQRQHLVGINDIRIAAELAGALEYFFAAWELPGVGWKHPIVPDAVFRMSDHTFAVEYDRGLEDLKYFVGLKMAAYRRGLPEFPLDGVLVVVDSEARRRALTEAIGGGGLFEVRLLDTVLREGMLACCCELSSRENGFLRATDFEAVT